MTLPLLDFHTHKSYEVPEILGLTCEPCEAEFIWCYGIHPWFIDDKWPIHFEKLKNKCRHRKPLMIGEIGLDRVRGIDIQTQLKAFRAQLDLADELDIPSVIHSVKTHSEILATRKQYANKSRPWVLHDFCANQTIAEKITNMGCFLSFSPKAKQRYLSNDKKLMYLKNIDLNYIFLETDDCKEEDITEIFRWFSFVRGIDIYKLNDIFWNNLVRITGKTHECILAESSRITITRKDS